MAAEYRELQVGDTIKCKDTEEAAELTVVLGLEGIITDFLYEKDGEEGIWLVITELWT